MTVQVQVLGNAQAGGISFTSRATRTADSHIGHSHELAAAVAGVLSVRTDNDTGSVLSSGHGFGGGEVVDIFWDGGRRYGVTLGLTDVDNFTIDLGAGDNLPVITTPLTVCEQTVIDTDFDGDLLVAILASSTQKGCLCFRSAGPVVELVIDLVAGEMYQWLSDTGLTNPLDSVTVVDAVMTNGGVAAADARIAYAYDSIA